MVVNLNAKISDAMVMAGLSRSEIGKINEGHQIFGEAGLIDSLRLVRLISAISTSFEELNIDMFDMMVELDVEAIDAFAFKSNLVAFLERVTEAKLQGAA